MQARIALASALATAASAAVPGTALALAAPSAQAAQERNCAQTSKDARIAVSGYPPGATRKRVSVLPHRLEGYELVLRVRTMAAPAG